MDLNLWKKRKKELKFTYQDLADKSNLSLRNIKAIFYEEVTNPTIFSVQAIEKALGITDNPYTQGEVVESGKTLTEYETRLLRAFNRLTDTQKETILEMVESLANNKNEEANKHNINKENA